MMTKKEFDNMKPVNYNRYPILELNGSDDEDGFQIFTPDFIVNDMLEAVGISNIIDINKTILEPTSGDGAFTVRILDIRLKKILNEDRVDFLFKSSIALSTIYSIEMDGELMIKQRNNIYSLIHYYLKENNITFNEDYLKLIKDIIQRNFIWGETNIRKDKLDRDGNNAILGWYMPTEAKIKKLVYEEKEVKSLNLFGEEEIITITSKKPKEKIVTKSNRGKLNRIEIFQWDIKEDLSYSKKVVPIEVG